MTDDLGGLIRAAVDAEADTAARAFPYTHDTFGRVRREARRRRAVGGAAVATACVLVTGLAVAAVAQPWREPVAPVATSPASPDPTSDAQEPTPGPTPPPVLAPVRVDPHLPQAEALRAGLLEATAAGSGWAMLEYDGTVDTEQGTVEGPRVLYLLSPDGTLVQAADLTEAGTAVRLLDWRPGTGLVLLGVGTAGEATPESVRVLDVATGRVEGTITLGAGEQVFEAHFAPAGDDLVVVSARDRALTLGRYTTAGTPVATLLDGVPDDGTRPSAARYAPDGTSVVLGAGHTFERVPVDGSAPTPLPVPAGTLGCAPVRWWPDGRLLATCDDDLGPDTMGDPDGSMGTRIFGSNAWLVDLSGGTAPERLTDYVPSGDVGLTDLWDVEGVRYASRAGLCGGTDFGVAEPTGAFTRITEDVQVAGPWHDGFLGQARACGDPYAELVSVARDGSVTTVVPRVDGAYGAGPVVLP